MEDIIALCHYILKVPKHLDFIFIFFGVCVEEGQGRKRINAKEATTFHSMKPLPLPQVGGKEGLGERSTRAVHLP